MTSCLSTFELIQLSETKIPSQKLRKINISIAIAIVQAILCDFHMHYTCTLCHNVLANPSNIICYN